MKRKKNKKGLVSGLLGMMIVLFFFAIFSLASIYMWGQFENTIMSMPNETIDPYEKAQVQEAGHIVFWADKLFTYVFIALLIGYLISSVTIPVEEPIYFIIFIGFLIIFTLLAMALSNAWVYITLDATFIDAASYLPFTDYFLRYFPYAVFLIGLSGSIIFYGRKYLGSPGFNQGGGNAGNFE